MDLSLATTIGFAIQFPRHTHDIIEAGAYSPLSHVIWKVNLQARMVCELLKKNK